MNDEEIAKAYGQVEESEIGNVGTRNIHADEIGGEGKLFLRTKDEGAFLCFLDIGVRCFRPISRSDRAVENGQLSSTKSSFDPFRRMKDFSEGNLADLVEGSTIFTDFEAERDLAVPRSIRVLKTNLEGAPRACTGVTRESDLGAESMRSREVEDKEIARLTPLILSTSEDFPTDWFPYMERRLSAAR